MSRIAGRAVRWSALVAAFAVAYAAGFMTGTMHRPGPQRSVVDEAAERIARDAAHPVSRQELQRAAVTGMLSVLQDRWSRYYTPVEYDNFSLEMNGHYGGVGLTLGQGSADRVQVTGVQPGSPAARAGIRPGDVLESVGSTHPVASATVASLLRGEPGTTVEIVIERDGHDRTIRLVRGEVESRDVVVTRLSDHVIEIRVSAFTAGVGDQVRTAVASGGNGVVLDLRGNPGGLLREAVTTASAFLAGGPVVSYGRRGQPPQQFNATGPANTTSPLVVLVDHDTASAAEVVAAALQERNRAVIVGSRTYGKASVQEQLRLADGSALELTVGRYQTPNGRNLDGVGVEPDVLVASGSPRRAAEQRALAVLNGLLAASPVSSAKDARTTENRG